MRHEMSLARSRANVMMYDELTGQWIPASYSGPGLSHVDILHHFTNVTFRIVARSVQTNEVIICSNVVRGMRYNEATANFHQWRDNKVVYGLHFINNEEAEVFGSVMRTSLEVLNSGGHKRIPWPGSSTDDAFDDAKENCDGTLKEEEVYEECNFETEPDAIYHDMLRTASRPLLEQNFNRLGSFRSPSRQPQATHYSYPKHQEHYPQQNHPNQPHNQDPYSLARQPFDQGYSSVENVTQSSSSLNSNQFTTITPPTASTSSPSVTQQSAPPPPPPPPPSSQSPSAPSIKLKSVSDSLASVKLTSNSDTKVNTSAGGGMANMMEEMKNKLAKLRKTCDDDADDGKLNVSVTNLSSPKINKKPNREHSPSPFKMKMASTSNLTPAKSAMNKFEVISGKRGLELVNKTLDNKACLDKHQLEALKSEILSEIRTEIEKSKLEIIDIIRSELHKRS